VENPTRKQVDVVAGLIFAGAKLLVCQRHCKGAFPLKWEFPGGKVEAGESDVAALRRELNEELDIRVGEVRRLHRHRHDYPDGPSVRLSFFHVVAYQGVIKNLVFEQIVWSKLSDLLKFDFLEGDLALVQRLVDSGLSAFDADTDPRR